MENTLLAIDARIYNSRTEQYEEDEILRELNKAYVGFSLSGEVDEK